MLKYLFTFLVLFAGTLAAQVGNQVTSQPPVTPGDCVQFVSQTRISDAGAPCGSGGGGAVSSVSNSDGTLTISPTTGAVIAGIALGHANSWTGTQTFTNLTVTGTCTGCGSGSGANTTLSNLTSPTALNQPLNNGTGTNAGSGLLNFGFPGTNGTFKNLIEAVDQNLGNVFNMSVESATFNSVVDNVACIGWNQRACGQISTSWGSIWQQWEANYVPSAVQVMEYHDIVADTTGAQHRFFTSQFFSSNGVDQFADFNLNNGMAWQCLVATGSPCSTDGLSVRPRALLQDLLYRSLLAGILWRTTEEQELRRLPLACDF